MVKTSKTEEAKARAEALVKAQIDGALGQLATGGNMTATEAMERQAEKEALMGRDLSGVVNDPLVKRADELAGVGYDEATTYNEAAQTLYISKPNAEVRELIPVEQDDVGQNATGLIDTLTTGGNDGDLNETFEQAKEDGLAYEIPLLDTDDKLIVTAYSGGKVGVERVLPDGEIRAYVLVVPPQESVPGNDPTSTAADIEGMSTAQADRDEARKAYREEKDERRDTTLHGSIDSLKRPY